MTPIAQLRKRIAVAESAHRKTHALSVWYLRISEFCDIALAHPTKLFLHTTRKWRVCISSVHVRRFLREPNIQERERKALLL